MIYIKGDKTGQNEKMPITFTNCNKCLNCHFIFMMQELENNLCIRCFIKKIKDKEKKILDNWIDSVLID